MVFRATRWNSVVTILNNVATMLQTLCCAQNRLFQIVPCDIALKLPKAVDAFSILKITCSSFESSICIFCCRVPPHGESLHGFLTGARYNRYLNVYTQVNTTSNGPSPVENSSLQRYQTSYDLYNIFSFYLNMFY